MQDTLPQLCKILMCIFCLMCKTFPIIKTALRNIILLQTQRRNKNASPKIRFLKEIIIMKNDKLTAQGRETMEKFKMEAANEVGVNLRNGYNGDITAREAGSVGGMMVKKMIENYKQGLNG